MTKIKDVCQVLEQWAPISWQESYDNSGLLVGDKNCDVTNVLVSLDCTEDVVQDAINQGCNMIIAHHPIIFSGLKKITGSDYIQRTIIKAIKNDVAIYAIHTNLDNAFGGVSHKIAEKLDLRPISTLQPKKGEIFRLSFYVPKDECEKVKEKIFEAGAGAIGNYDSCSFNIDGTGTFKAKEGAEPYIGDVGKIHREQEAKVEVVVQKHQKSAVVNALLLAHPYEEVAYEIYAIENTSAFLGGGLLAELTKEMPEMDFLKKIKSVFNCGTVRYTPLLNKPIKKVALCGGSGSYMLPSARALGADLFLTADFKYHQFFDAENDILIADIGHYESEYFTIELIIDHLKEKFTNFAFCKTIVNTNPINYL